MFKTWEFRGISREDFEGNLEGYLEGSFEGDLEGGLEGEFKFFRA